jgi:hypothetical protein
VRHWRLVIGLGRMPFFVACVLAVWLFVLPFLAGGARDKHGRVVLAICLSVLVPGLVVASIWPRRWFVLADESLRPASRRQFVREQGAAMAVELALTWLVITVGTFAAALLYDPSTMLASPLWRALPVTAAGQLLTFGVIVWVLRYRSGWLVIVPIFLATVVGLGVLIVGGTLAEREAIGPMLKAAAIFATVGLVITADAYRRWLATEFD